jgi:hypothetical protein
MVAFAVEHQEIVPASRDAVAHHLMSCGKKVASGGRISGPSSSRKLAP